MKVGVVMVSYADRANYFERVLQRLETLPLITDIVLVCNNISTDSYAKLEKIKAGSSKLRPYVLDTNMGSAGGYKAGIQQILECDIDFIWMLDDDNLPSESALDHLVTNWNSINPENREKIFSLLSYRTDREIYKQAVKYQNPKLMLGPQNSFLGFHFSYKILKRKRQGKLHPDAENLKWGPVSVAPYGGMFYHRTLIGEIGLPNENFFLYADDLDFSYRISKKGGHIYLMLDSVIDDLETSFHLKQSNSKRKGLWDTRFFNTDNEDAIFFSVRNNIVFEQNFVQNKFIYTVNKYLYLALLFVLFALKRKQFWKFPIILSAVRHASKMIKEDEN